MNTFISNLKYVAFAALIVLSGLTAYSVVPSIYAVEPEECPNADVYNWKGNGNPNNIAYRADEGMNVVGVCIGSDGEWHSQVLDNGTWGHGCFEITGVGTSGVQVARVKHGCDHLDHIDLLLRPVTPEPSVSPTPRPSASIDPSTSPRPRPSVSPSINPEPSVSPEPQPSNVTMSVDGPVCFSSTFKVHAHAEENGVPAVGHDVQFKYANQTTNVTTDAGGNASADFTYVDVNVVYATVTPWATVEHSVNAAGNCSPTPGNGGGGTGGTNTNGDVLGASTGGDVLGASTLANTGSITNELMSTIFVVGFITSITGIALQSLSKKVSTE